MALHAKINTHFATLFAAFVEKLRASPDGDGSVLDHSLIVFGARHERRPGALRLSAAARGDRRRRRRMKGNRFIVAAEWTPVANFWLGVAGMFGSPIEQFGESNGRVEL